MFQAVVNAPRPTCIYQTVTDCLLQQGVPLFLSRIGLT
jgi:hypothetical protein